MFLFLLLACFDAAVELAPHPTIERLDPLVIHVTYPREQTFGSAEVSVPAYSTLPIVFETHGTNYFGIVIENGSSVHLESTRGFGPVTHLALNFRKIRYAVFNDPFVPGYDLALEATNDTIIDGVKMYIGYSDSPDYLVSYQQQSGGSYALNDSVTWSYSYSCVSRIVNGVSQPRECTQATKEFTH